jgi:hypothetical protein
MSDAPAVQSLIVLFTANLRADFARLPRLSSTIQQIRAALAQSPRPILLLDLGGAWSADSWVCQATANRAPYLVLDAMSYAAVRADGLDRDAIFGLQSTVQLRLLDDHLTYRWAWREVSVNIGPGGTAPCVTWAAPGQQRPSPEAVCLGEHGRLTLFPLSDGLGFVEVVWPRMQVAQTRVIPIDPTARPDPSIVACVEFVEREARAYLDRLARERGRESRDEAH